MRTASCYENGPTRRRDEHSETLTGARTMWELVDRRADASPDHPMLIAPDGENVTLRRVPGPGRAGRRRPRGHGRHDGLVVSWQLPTRIDTVVLSIALARLGAVQNPIIHLYREREVGFALRQTGAEPLRHPRHVARHRLRRHRRLGRSATSPTRPRSSAPKTGFRKATPRPASASPGSSHRRTPRFAGSTTRRVPPRIPRGCSTPTRP